MTRLEQHIAENAERIEREAKAYAKTYGCTLEKARQDVAGEYAQGWHDEMDARRMGDYE